MPTYTVKCEVCGDQQDIFRRMADCDDTPECHGQRMRHVLHAPMVIADIQPYRAIAVDKKTGEQPYITSRRQHQEFLKRNNYTVVEQDSRKREMRGDFNVKPALIEATKKVLNK